MAKRYVGPTPHPIKVAVDLYGIARVRQLGQRGQAQDVVRGWLDAHPSQSTYVAGESGMIGASFVKAYEFRDRAFADAFRKAFEHHLVPRHPQSAC